MNKRKKRFWSFMLSIMMVLGLLWAVPGDSKAVAEDSGVGVWTGSGDTSEEFTYDNDNEIWVVVDDGGNTCDVTKLNKIVAKDSGISISGGVLVVGNEHMEADVKNAPISVGYTKKLVCGTCVGEVNNEGTFVCDSFDGTLTNESVATAECNSFKGTLENRGSFSCNSFEGSPKNSSTINVVDSFKNTDSTLTSLGVIEAEGPTTKIGSAGGEFKLKYGSKVKVITTAVANNTEAWTLMDLDDTMEPVKFSFAPGPDIEPGITDDIHVYNEGKEDEVRFVKKSFNIVPEDGCAIGYNKNEYDWNSLNITKEKYEAIKSDSDFKFFVLKKPDYSYRLENPDDGNALFGKFVFDDVEPEITSITFKKDGQEILKPAAGDLIKANKITVDITAKDENLLEIIKGQGGTSTPITATGSTFSTTLEYNADPDATEPQSCYFQVYDKAGNEISLGFNLEFKKVNYTASLSMNDVFYGETLKTPVISSELGDWDGEINYSYSNDDGATFTSTKPVAAGEYKVKADLTGSKQYNDTSLKADFKIKRYELTASVSVPSEIIVGNSYVPNVSKPSDWVSTGGNEDEIVLEYKALAAPNDAYSTTKPQVPGTYIVRATIPETDKYESVSVESSSYVIKKATPAQATLTLSDMEVGDKFSPNLATDSDGEVTYKYKPASEIEYANTITEGTVIDEAGDYTAMAFIDESDSYSGINSNEASFSVKKRKVTLGVTVESTVVGEPVKIKYTPSFEIPLDVQIKNEYKGKDEPDSAYTETLPTKAGDYKVKATITGSKIYEDASAEAEFTIGRKTPTTCSVDVADVLYGETISPVVTTDSDGKTLATFEYKKKDEPVSAYSPVVPVKAGDYSIRATVPKTDTYEQVQCESTFSIGKLGDDTIKVSVPDTVVGTEYEPILTTASDGKASAIYKYKLKTDDDSAYSTAKPSAAGEYVICVIVPETETYKEQTCMATFTISKKKPSVAEVSIAEKINLGEALTPTADVSPYDGPNSPVFEYKLQSEDDTAYTSKEPTEAGKYSVRAVIKESDEWYEIICKPAKFILGEIKTAQAKVEIPDVYVGTKYEPLLTTDSDGKDKAVFEYKIADDEKAEFSKDKPTKAGKYIVKATVPATDTYHEAVCTAAFTISRITAKDSNVKVKDSYVGSDYSPVVTTDSDGKDKAVFEYRPISGNDSEYSKKKPDKAGEYKVRATIPQTDRYEKVVCDSTFKIIKKIPEVSVKLSDQYVGVKYKPVFTTDSNGKGKAFFEYKSKDDDDDAYSKDKPVNEGEYVVRVTVPETDEYEKATAETEFTIAYLIDNNITYIISGKNGKNGYYTSDVYLEAPKGYEISLSADGKYYSKLLYKPEIKKVYLKRSSDDAMMKEIEISNEIKIDKDAPELVSIVDDENKSVTLPENAEIYSDKLTLVFSDEHLASVRVNEDILTAKDNKKTVELDSDGGDMYFAVTAEDLAGNTYTFSFTLKAAWMKSNTIPKGKKVKLQKGKGYKLESGRWKVNGDSTVYSGGGMFYVTTTGDYTFTEE